MLNPIGAVRGLSILLISAALLATSGCSWVRGTSGYELSPEMRPLEIPPELDAPTSDAALRIPQVATTAPRTEARAFTLGDTLDSAWERSALALTRIEGVEVLESSKLLGVHTVSYEGERVLIRLSAEADGTRVSASDTDGRTGSAAATKLLGQLRQRLG